MQRIKGTSNKGIITLGLIFTCIMGCIVAIFLSIFNNNPIVTASETTSIPTKSLAEIIAHTMVAAQAQTSAAASPTPEPSLIPTETLASTIEIESTSTIFIFELQTDVAAPTLFVLETNTPFVLATQPPSQENAVCSCSGNTLNCGDFSSQASAQACFNYCVSKGAGDIHKLDRDNDGSACEG